MFGLSNFRRVETCGTEPCLTVQGSTLHEFCTMRLVAKRSSPSLNPPGAAAAPRGSEGVISRKGAETVQVSNLRAKRGSPWKRGIVIQRPGRGRFARVSPLESERRIDKIIHRAAEVLGNPNEAMRWLGNPVRALNFATPISVLGTKQGTKRVNDILGQMESGVW